MLKGVFLLLVAVAAGSLGQTFDDAVPLNQRSVDFNNYYLQTKPPAGLPIQLTDDNLDLLTDGITLVVVHGHEENYMSAMGVDIVRGLLEETDSDEDFNVILVDWSVQAGYSYSNAEAAVPFIGSYLADYLTTLSTAGVTPENMHIVGFNLGAHIAGWAGRILSGRDTPVARITALDPSKCSNRLTRTDATYVEVIHTDGWGLLANGLGEQMGDADFFPNGGSSQPGCLTHSCSHERAWRFFVASLGWNDFQANCCTSISQMRLNACRSNSLHQMGGYRLVKVIGSCGTGIYRVNTRSSFPF